MGLERVRFNQVEHRGLSWPLALSVCLAIIVHLAMWQVLTVQAPPAIKADLPDIVTVTLIETKPPIETPVVEDKGVEDQVIEVLPKPEPEPEPDLTPEPELRPSPITPPPARTIPSPNITQDAPSAPTTPKLIIDTPNTSGPVVDERFRLKGWSGPVDDKLKGLQATTDCFGFSTKCAEQRKTLYAKYQVTPEERALEQRAPHVGLPAEFYGLSEREIRKKLGVPFAGENGQVIIPFVLKIDGPLWDSLHGVKKHCKNVSAGNDARGQAYIKDCGSYRRADGNAFQRFEQIKNGETVLFQDLPDLEEEKR